MIGAAVVAEPHHDSFLICEVINLRRTHLSLPFLRPVVQRDGERRLDDRRTALESKLHHILMTMTAGLRYALAAGPLERDPFRKFPRHIWPKMRNQGRPSKRSIAVRSARTGGARIKQFP